MATGNLSRECRADRSEPTGAPADGQAHTPADGKTDDASDSEGHDDVSSGAFDHN